MPVYTYQVVHDDGAEGETFDVIRKMSDPPLKKHPDTGEKVKRIYQPIHIAGITNERHSKQLLTDKNLSKNGFTKYQKNGKGHYERTVGNAGPAELHAD
jgi:hypothetical protein